MKAKNRFIEKLESSGFSLKPAFYLMNLSQITESLDAEAMLGPLSNAAEDINAKILETRDEPTESGFGIVSMDRIDDHVFEIRLKWEVPVRYWDPKSVETASVTSLKVGFVLIHTKARKALVSCHTLSERSHITQIVAAALNIRFHPLVLTKDLLDQIGTFDTVRRAAYFFGTRRPDRATNITYADDLLGAIPEVRAHEESTEAERKLSFYRIPLTGLGERGVGATSDSAKLWIPSETPVATIREFGIALLEKVTGTLKRMKKEGNFDGILKVVLSDSNPNLSSITPIALRRDVQDLAVTLIHMLVRDEGERASKPSAAFLISGIPNYFEYARIAIFDDEAGTGSYWRHVDGSELLKFELDGGVWKARTYPSAATIDLNKLVDPNTSNFTSADDPRAVVRLLPTKRLHDLLVGIIQSLSGDIPELKNIVALPFSFSSGVLRLDVRRARNKKKGALVGKVIAPADVAQFSRILDRKVSAAKRVEHLAILNGLGEKCKRMNDQNCQACLDDGQFLCLRSLLARYVEDHLLLAHKGIELCDLQGTVQEADGPTARVFFFSKLAKGDKGLTLRNSYGAILLAQILAHVDKTTYNTIGVLSSSTINEDLRERLQFLGGLADKSVIFVDGPLLVKMLDEFEDQSTFDGLNPELVYKLSRAKSGALPDGKKAPGQLLAPKQS